MGDDILTLVPVEAEMAVPYRGSGLLTRRYPGSLRGNRRGQSTVEYMLVISVIVIAVVAIVYQYFFPQYGKGLDAMQNNIETMTEDGVVGG